MASLLVSVRSAAEARICLDGGADVIDVKDPDRGPLGMARAEVTREIVGTVAGLRSVSVALGELREWSRETIFQSDPNIDYYKLGLSGTAQRTWGKRVQDFLAERAIPRARFIAVAYAEGPRVDAPAVDAVLETAVARGWRGLLIDTYQKTGSWTGDYLAASDLRRLAGQCRRHDLLFAVAGSLTLPRIETLQSVQPDLFAVRGAACAEGNRNGQVDLAAVQQLARVTRAEGRFAKVEGPARED